MADPGWRLLITYISRVMRTLSIVTLLVTLLASTHEPPSTSRP